MTQEVTAIRCGWSNTNAWPYALAELACGHIESVILRPTSGRCMVCGTVHQALPKYPERCSCGRSHFGELNSPNPHVEADRLTKVGDVVECKKCAAEAAQLEWLRGLDMSTIHHTRFRHGSIYLYRLDPTSPSNFMLVGGVAPTPANEALLRGRLAPLSPTELA